jgi:3-hydroxyisobutyrate dehydrogenase
MCGGSDEAFSRARPILENIRKKIVYLGESGCGQRMKAVNQIGVALGIVAMTEALVFAARQGLNPHTTLDILQAGAAGSWAFSNYAPRLLAGDFKPGFSAEHMLKDLKIALVEAGSLCDLPGTAGATQLFENLVATTKGLGNHALIKSYR